MNLRVYVTTLEQFKKLYLVNEQQLATQKIELNSYKTIIANTEISNMAQEKALAESLKLNEDLQTSVAKYKKKAGRWPYWLGGGFIGGLVLCQFAR